MRDFSVRVITVEPGAFRSGLTDTDILIPKIQATYDKLHPEIKEQYGQEFVDKCKYLRRFVKASISNKVDLRCMRGRASPSP